MSIGAKRHSGDGSGERKLPFRSAWIRQKVEPSALVASSRMVLPGGKPRPQSDVEQREIVAGSIHPGAGIAGIGQTPPVSTAITRQSGRRTPNCVVRWNAGVSTRAGVRIAGPTTPVAFAVAPIPSSSMAGHRATFSGPATNLKPGRISSFNAWQACQTDVNQYAERPNLPPARKRMMSGHESTQRHSPRPPDRGRPRERRALP